MPIPASSRCRHRREARVAGRRHAGGPDDRLAQRHLRAEGPHAAAQVVAVGGERHERVRRRGERRLGARVGDGRGPALDRGDHRRAREVEQMLQRVGLGSDVPLGAGGQLGARSLLGARVGIVHRVLPGRHPARARASSASSERRRQHGPEGTGRCASAGRRLGPRPPTHVHPARRRPPQRRPVPTGRRRGPCAPRRTPGGRQRPVQRVRDALPRPPRPNRHLRRPGEPRRGPLLHRLRSRGRRRDRPDREEAALPRRSRGPRLLDRDRRLPVPLLVLPELGDRPGAAPRPRPADAQPSPVEGGGRGAERPGARDRLHLRRADRLPRVRPRHRARGSRGRPAQCLRDRRLRHARGDRPPAALP